VADITPKAWAGLLAGAVIALDRLTKLWIETRVELFHSVVVIPGFFNIIHTENRGMIFGFMAESNGAWRSIVLIGVAAAVLVLVGLSLWNLPARLPLGQKNTRLALALILGGAVGNLWDRLVRGAVTDFLEFYIGAYSWPAFNVADSAITVGAALLLLDLMRARRTAPQT
jgi:signal peptidase II